MPFRNPSARNRTAESGRNAFRNLVIGDIACDDRSCPDHGTLSDGDAAKDDCTAANGCASFHTRWDDLPVVFRLQLPVVGCGARIQVIDKHHTVSYENVVFDGYAFANEGVGRNFAAISNDGIFLHFDEGADLGFIADSAAVKVD